MSFDFLGLMPRIFIAVRLARMNLESSLRGHRRSGFVEQVAKTLLVLGMTVLQVLSPHALELGGRALRERSQDPKRRERIACRRFSVQDGEMPYDARDAIVERHTEVTLGARLGEQPASRKQIAEPSGIVVARRPAARLPARGAGRNRLRKSAAGASPFQTQGAGTLIQ